MTNMKMLSSKKLINKFKEDNVDIRLYKDINPLQQILIEAYFFNELKFIYACGNIVFYKVFEDYLKIKFNLKKHNVRHLVKDLEYYNLISTSNIYNKQVLRLNTNVINFFSRTLKYNILTTNRITNNGLYRSCYISHLIINLRFSILENKYFINRQKDYITFYLFDFQSSSIDLRYLKDLIEKEFLKYNFKFKIAILTYEEDRKEVLNKIINKDTYFRNVNFLGFQDIINTDLKNKFFTYSAQK
jgi:hypothetical protein